MRKDMVNEERNLNTENLYAKRRKKRSGFAARTLVAAAACAALVIAAGTLTGSLQSIFRHSDSKNAKDTLLTAVDRMFTLQVNAAGVEEGQWLTLSEGHAVPIVLNHDKSNSWVFCGDEAEGVNYCIGIPQMICEGDEIKSITYSINNGAFQIVQPENEGSIVIDGQLYDGELNTGSIGGDYNEERDGAPSRPFETVLYKSFTLDYNRQSDEYTWINICNERSNSKDIIDLLWGEGSTNEEFNSGVQKMLDHTVITCTVNYADNTSQSADIQVDSCMMTREEAGEILDPDMDPAYLLEETVVITFELLRQQEEAHVQ